jgi:hypothetical protein
MPGTRFRARRICARGPRGFGLPQAETPQPARTPTVPVPVAERGRAPAHAEAHARGFGGVLKGSAPS